MKKILFLFLTAIAVLSCRKSAADGPKNVIYSVEGNWYLYSNAIEGSATSNGLAIPVVSNTVSNDCGKKSTFVFNGNKTGSMSIWNDQSGACTQLQQQDFTYVYDPNAETVTTSSSTSGTTTFRILQLDETQMTLTTTVTNQQIAGYNFTGKVTYVLKKK